MSPALFLALEMWIVPHWVGWYVGFDGRAHPIPVDSYGRPRNIRRTA